MPVQVEQSGLAIVEAKDALREGIEQFPNWPSVRLVRELAVAYLGPNPKVSKERETDWSHVVNYGPWDKYLRVISHQVATIEMGEDEVELDLETRTNHKKRLLMPGAAFLGGLAFKPEATFSPLERLHLQTPEDRMMLEVSPGSEMRTLQVAEILLALPDEPTYLDQ